MFPRAGRPIAIVLLPLGDDRLYPQDPVDDLWVSCRREVDKSPGTAGRTAFARGRIPGTHFYRGLPAPRQGYPTIHSTRRPERRKEVARPLRPHPTAVHQGE